MISLQDFNETVIMYEVMACYCAEMVDAEELLGVRRDERTGGLACQSLSSSLVDSLAA